MKEFLIILAVILSPFLIRWILDLLRSSSNSSSDIQPTSKIPPVYDTGPKTRQITDISDIEITSEFLSAIKLIEENRKSVFLTGKAGTGKSTFLRYLKAITNRQFIILAPTGLAAVNVGGQTIHSFFKFPAKFLDKDSIRRSKNADVMKKLELLIIDEASMIRADLMDAIDQSLQLNRNSKLPFGGVQILLIGDLHQLPPIVKEYELKKYFEEHHGGEYFFHAHTFKGYRLGKIELTHIFRQKDDTNFVTLLNALRSGNITDEQIDLLNVRVYDDSSLDHIPDLVNLTTTNDLAFQKNDRRLSELPGVVFEFTAQISGQFPDSSYPTEALLRLKIGAQIMMLRNDSEGRWVNGTICQVSGLSKNSITVVIDGRQYQVTRDKWENREYYYDAVKGKISQRIIGVFEQFPLKLAWAMTIHKSQGQSFDNISIDLGRGAFAHGQTYVAFSRCRKLDGIHLSRPLMRSDIIVDKKVNGVSNIFH